MSLDSAACDAFALPTSRDAGHACAAMNINRTCNGTYKKNLQKDRSMRFKLTCIALLPGLTLAEQTPYEIDELVTAFLTRHWKATGPACGSTRPT